MFWKEAREKYANTSKDDEDIRKYYELSVEFQNDLYKGITGYLQDLGHKFIFSHTKEGNILDIGFGSGRSYLYYKGNTDDYYPIDINASLIKADVWKKYKNAIIADARNIPFPDNYFENIVSEGALEHIKEIDIVMSEARRVLKANGRFLVALPCEDGLAWNLGRELTSRPYYMNKYKLNYAKLIAYGHVHSLAELRKILKMYFKVEKERFYPFLLPIIDINVMYCAALINVK